MEGGATRIIDADGLLVTPGWVDIHTHYDGQATWDSELAPSSWHGVTTLVMGNCGVGLRAGRSRPPRLAHRPHGGGRGHPRRGAGRGDRVGVGDLPRVPRRTGAAALDGRRRHPGPPRRGAGLRHGRAGRAQRGGERRGHRGHAGHRARGAAGRGARVLHLAHHRAPGHRRRAGARAPYAAEDELFGIGSALGEAGAGVFELAPLGSAGEMLEDVMDEVDWMRRLSAAIDRPVSYVLLQIDDDPELWRKQLAASLDACAEGRTPLPADRRAAHGHPHRAPHDAVPLRRHPGLPGAAARGACSAAELAAALADPEVRRSIVSWTPSSPAEAEAMEKAYGRTFVLGDPPDYEPGPERSLAGLAAARGVSPLEVAYDEMAARRRAGPAVPPHPQLRHGRPRPRARDAAAPAGPARALADGGAHTGTICDALHAHLHAHPLDAGPQPRVRPCRSSTS